MIATITALYGHFRRPPRTLMVVGALWLAVLSIGFMPPGIPAATDWYQQGMSELRNGNYDQAIRNFSLTLEILPRDYESLSHRGVAWFYKQVYDKAIDDATRAVEINPHYTTGANHLAWMLATCPDPRYRDGSRAVVLAEKLVERYPDANFLDTLAAAYFEAGNKAAALRVQRLAIDGIGDQVSPEDRNSFNKRLESYDQAISESQAAATVSTQAVGNEADGRMDRAGVEPAMDPSRQPADSPQSAGNGKPQGTAAMPGEERWFTVHVYSLRRQELALENAASLWQGDYPVYVQRTLVKQDPLPWFRVCSGAFRTRQAAKAHADSLKQSGMAWAGVVSLPVGLIPVSPVGANAARSSD